MVNSFALFIYSVHSIRICMMSSCLQATFFEFNEIAYTRKTAYMKTKNWRHWSSFIRHCHVNFPHSTYENGSLFNYLPHRHAFKNLVSFSIQAYRLIGSMARLFHRCEPTDRTADQQRTCQTPLAFVVLYFWNLKLVRPVFMCYPLWWNWIYLKVSSKP